MSINFYNYIQPSIIKCGDTKNIPENLRNKFMININAMSIRWFVDNYMLIEDPATGTYMYMITHDGEKLRLDEKEDYGCDFQLLTNVMCNHNNCKECIKEYFTNKVESGE